MYIHSDILAIYGPPLSPPSFVVVMPVYLKLLFRRAINSEKKMISTSKCSEKVEIKIAITSSSLKMR